MKKTNLKFWVFVFAAILVIFIIVLIKSKAVSQLPTTNNQQPTTLSPTPTVYREKAFVNYVFDGDTIELAGKITVRLLGIDAPETANKYTMFKSECFATESAKIAKELLAGQTIEIEKDMEDKDSYGRLLRYIFLDDIFINEFMVRQGFARVIEKTINTKYKPLLTDAENEAKREKRGLWGKCVKVN